MQEVNWSVVLSLGIVSTLVSLVVNFIKARNWSWTTIQLLVAVFSIVGAAAYYWAVQIGFDWEAFSATAASILVAANGIYTLFIKPFMPEFSKGR